MKPTFQDALANFLEAIARARDLQDAQRVVQMRIELVQDARFLPALAIEFGAPAANSMMIWMTQMALANALNEIPPARLGAGGLIVLLALGEQKLQAFANEYAAWLDDAFFARLRETLAALETVAASDFARVLTNRLRAASGGLRVRRAMDALKLLIEQLFYQEPQTFMQTAVAQARRADRMTGESLETVIQDFFAQGEFGALGVAFSAWSLQRAIDLVSEIDDTDTAALADLLCALAMRQIGEWTRDAALSNDLKTTESWSRIAVWLVWGNQPSKPQPTLKQLARVRNENDLRKLVEQEPWLLTAPAIDNIRGGGIFVLIPELLGRGKELERFAQWLERWLVEFARSDKNPIASLAQQVYQRNQSLEQAKRALERVKGLTVLHVAALDESLQSERYREPEYATILAELNHFAASRLNNRLLLGYTALAAGFVRLERAPAIEIKPHLEQAVTIARELEHPMLLGQALDSLGQVHAALGEIPSALQLFAESQRACRRLPPGYGRAETLLHIAGLYLERDEQQLGERFLRYVSHYLSPDEVSVNAGRYWFLWGGLLWYRGDREGTRAAWDRAEAIGRALNNSQILDEVQRHRAQYELEMGETASARGLLEQAAAATAPSERVRLLQVLAMLAWREGEYQEAIEQFRLALVQARAQQNKQIELNVRLRLMLLYQELDWRTEADQEQARCQELAYELGDESVQVHLLLSRGLSAAQSGLKREALIAYRAALYHAHAHNQKRFVDTLLQNIGACYLDLGKPQLAGLILTAAEAFQSKHPTPLAKLGIQLNRGKVWALEAQQLEQAGQTEAAQVALEKAEQIWRAAAERTDVTVDYRLASLANLATLYAAANKLSQRAWAYRFAVTLLEQQRWELTSAVLQKRFLREHASFYGAAIEACVQAEQFQEAVAIAEQLRARALGARLLQLESVPAEFESEFRRAQRELEQAQDHWLGVGITRGDWSDQRWAIQQSSLEQELDLSTLAHQVERARAAFESVVEKIRAQYPDFAALSLTNALTCAQIQHLLNTQQNTAFVYLTPRPKGTVACLVTLHKVTGFILPLTLEQITTMLNLLRMSRARPEGYLRQAQWLAGFFSTESFARTIESLCIGLGRWLWSSLAAQLDAFQIKKVILIPDSFLALLPLSAAPLPQANDEEPLLETTEWVLDRYAVSFAPSAQVWQVCQARAAARRGQNWLGLFEGVIGDTPLSAALAATLEDTFGAGKALWSERTNLEKFQTQSSHADLLHIHAHGRFDADLPESAALDLAWERNAQGYHVQEITLAEINQQLRLERARLVALSSCESGEVAMERVPEFIGIATAFLGAGASTVIASQWRVDETATVLLYAEFYRQLARGVTIGDALQTAQRWLRETSRAEILSRLEELLAQIKVRVKELPLNEAASAQTALRGAQQRLRAQAAILQRLLEKLSERDAKVASQLLLEELRAHPQDQDKLEAFLYKWLENLWMELTSVEWDTPRLIDQLRRLYGQPFVSPYYWGGCQVVGSAD